MGISPLITKHISLRGGQVQTLIQNAFHSKLILSFLYSSLVLLMFFTSYNKPELLKFVLISSLYHIFLSFYTWLRAVLQGLQRFKIDAFFSTLDKLLLILFLSYLYLQKKMSIDNYAYSFLLSAAISLLILLFYFWVNFKFRTFTVSFAGVYSLLVGTIFLALVNILFAFNDRLVFVLIEGKSSFSDTGLYFASYRWVNAISTYIWTVLPYFYAKFSYEYTLKDYHNDFSFHIKHLLTFIPVLLVAAFIFTRGEVLFWQLKKSTNEELTIMKNLLSIQMIGLLINSWLTIFGTFLNATNNERLVFYVLLIGTVINYVSIYYGLEYFGVYGAAWAGVFFYCLIGFGFYGFFKSRNPYQYLPKHIVSQFISIVIFIVSCFFIKKFSLPILVPEIISVLLFFVSMFLLGELRPNMFRELFKQM